MADQFTRWLFRVHDFSKHPADFYVGGVNVTSRERHAASIVEHSLWCEMKDDQKQWFLKAPGKLFELWLEDNIEHSGKVAMDKARDEIYEAMSMDGQRGSRSASTRI